MSYASLNKCTICVDSGHWIKYLNEIFPFDCLKWNNFQLLKEKRNTFTTPLSLPLRLNVL